MPKLTAEAYAQRLSQLVKCETVSSDSCRDRTKFYKFQELLRSTFPSIFAVCECEDFDGSFLLRWRGEGLGEPIMLMNHYDVVEAVGEWKYPPFGGVIAEGRVWGRGTLDNKGGLFCMLSAADELASEGFRPAVDVYFVSTCTEECDGSGADKISSLLAERGIRCSLVLDEGGMIVEEPIGGAKGKFAMIGVGEKGCVDLKFIAHSRGGHASTPGRSTPLVRLGKFMAAVEKKRLFKVKISDTVHGMLKCISRTMSGVMRTVLGHSRLLSPLISRVMPSVSDTAGAMLRTTVAFTMASGSQGTNVLPEEAWVVANMRTSHHQGREASIEILRRLAQRYDIETVILDGGFDSPLCDHTSEAFRLLERAVGAVFPTVITSPYIMTGASDCRFMSRISDNCLRFAPFIIDDEQMDSIHGRNESVDISALPTAVKFYKYILEEQNGK